MPVKCFFSKLGPSVIVGLVTLCTAVLGFGYVANAQLLGPEEFFGNPVARIEFEGLRRVEDAAVAQVLKSREGEVLRPDIVSEDIRAIYKMGYFKDVSVSGEGTPDGRVIVVFQVAEKSAVRRVRIEGNDEISTADIEEVIDISPLTIVRASKLRDNQQKVQDLYSEKGFYLAQVSVDTVPVDDNQVDVVFRILEQAKVQVRSVRFIGNQNVSSLILKSSIETQEGNFLSFLSSTGLYKKEAFEIDLLRISAQYFDRGYINVKIDPPDVELSPDRRYVYITIRVEEGEQFNIGSIDVSGDLLFPKEELMKYIGSKEGEVFNRSKLGEDLKRLKTLYEDKGYAYANVSPLTRVDPEKRLVDLTFDFQRGEKVYYERINIVGNTRTRDKVIRRELRIYEGELTTATGREVSKRRVTQLGYFESVEILTKPGSTPDLQLVDVKVVEKATGTFQIGAGFSSTENFIATAQISQQNFLGRGQTIELSAQISDLRQLFRLRFTEPYLFDTKITLSLNAFNTETRFDAFSRSATGGELTLGYPITDAIFGFLTYGLEFVESSDNNQVAVASLTSDGRVSSIRGSLSWDTRNNRLYPSSGMYHSLSMEVSNSAIGSTDNRNFERYRGFMRFYRPMPFSSVAKLSLKAGYIHNSSDSALPPSEKFQMGGINSLRGYPIFEVGPEEVAPINTRGLNALDFNNALTSYYEGGDKEFLMNLELEIPIFTAVGIRGVLFLDAGNVYGEDETFFYLDGNLDSQPCVGTVLSQQPFRCRNSSFDPRDLPLGLLWSAGFGIRWFSPIGPLRFEWGFPLTPRPSDGGGTGLEFSIGNSF